ncbi:acyltransferase family protein [Paratractidigestivibacter faecalis]|uniref:acyltransferase family protein n=1 Tax=Paratractidigestivibacter faecalis TaxID=2292441 RepID=UPI00388DDC02
MADQTSAQAGAPSAKPRQFKYDFVRFVAMTWVIGVHALTVVDTGRRLGSWYVVLCQAVFFTANAIFFMLSGKFNLVLRNGEEWLGFYVRKARSILLPVLVLFLIRTGYDMWPALGTPLHFLKSFVFNLLENFGHREYWFVFQLLFMLVVTPFLVPVVESLNSAKKKLLFALCFVWFAVSFFMTNWGHAFGYTFLFWGFWFAYLIGPFVEELFAEATRRRVLMLAGVLAPFATLAAVLYGYSSGAFDSSPFYLITYVGLYGLLLWLGDRVVPSLRRPISFCARRSFTVYMIYMMVLIPLSAAVPKLYGVASLVEHVGLSVVTIVICVLLSALLDALLIKPLQRLFDIQAQKLAK